MAIIGYNVRNEQSPIETPECGHFSYNDIFCR